MPLLRSLILILALMVQVMPVVAVTHEEAVPVCGMKCCPPGATTCCCAVPMEAPVLPAPASTPPVTGREFLPATLRTTSTPLPPEAPDTVEATARLHACRADSHRHVRLAVLFCAILI